MKQKDKFRYAEKCLYNYKANLACLEVLRGDLQVKRLGSDVHAQKYNNPFGFSGEPSSPVYSYLVNIETLEEKIKYLERLTNPISKLIVDLNDDFLQILKLMYFEDNTQKKVMIKLNIPRSTFIRKRYKLVNLTINYLGL